VVHDLIDHHPRALTIDQTRQQQNCSDKHPSSETAANVQPATWRSLQGNTLPNRW
jgi:hypothetical protein